LSLVLDTDRKGKREFIAEAANREHIQLACISGIACDAATHNTECAGKQMERRTDRLLKIVLVGDFLT